MKTLSKEIAKEVTVLTKSEVSQISQTRYGTSQCGAKSNIFNPSLGLKNSRFALIFRYIPYIPLARTKREPKRSACRFTTYVGIVCDPSIEFIINRPRRNKTTMAKTASAIDVPLVQRRSYDTGTFLNPLGTPLREGFDVHALD